MTSLGLGDEAATATWLRFVGNVRSRQSPPERPGRSGCSRSPFAPCMNTGAVAPALAERGGRRTAGCPLATGTPLHALRTASGCGRTATRVRTRHTSWREWRMRWFWASTIARGELSCDVGDDRVLERRPRSRPLAGDPSLGQVLIDHGFEHAPAPVTVIATSALVEATSGDPKRAHEKCSAVPTQPRLLPRHRRLGQCAVPTDARPSKPRTGDHVSAKSLRAQEVRRYLEPQPDALRAHAQADEIDATLRAVRASALTGPSSLSTAELRVLHYLPSNLGLAEIGSRLFISRFTAKPIVRRSFGS